MRLKKSTIKIFTVVLAAVAVIGLTAAHTYANEINKAREEKTNLEKKKEETEKKLKELEKEKSDILNYIEKLDKELNKIAEDMEILNTDIALAEENLEETKAELVIAKETESQQYETMKKRIKYMYENGDTVYLNILLQSEDLADILNQVEYMAKITEYDNNLLTRYTQLKEEVIQKEEEIEEKLANLHNLKEELAYEQETVSFLAEEKNKELVKYEDSITEAAALSADITSKIEETEEEIEKLLEEERKRVEAEILAKKEEEKRLAEEKRQKEEAERLERERQEEERRNQENTNNSSSQTPPETTDSGSNSSNQGSGNTNSTPSEKGFIWPVPSSGRITSYFGGRTSPTAGASSDHKGLDIGAPTGTKIVAAKGGTVVTASYQVAAGNYIMISHGDGVYTVYMHCSKLLVSVGDYVNQGEEIALVGSTGISTGPHLHFGVSVNGAYVDPLGYIKY